MSEVDIQELIAEYSYCQVKEKKESTSLPSVNDRNGWKRYIYDDSKNLEGFEEELYRRILSFHSSWIKDDNFCKYPDIPRIICFSLQRVNPANLSANQQSNLRSLAKELVHFLNDPLCKKAIVWIARIFGQQDLVRSE